MLLRTKWVFLSILLLFFLLQDNFPFKLSNSLHLICTGKHIQVQPRQWSRLLSKPSRNVFCTGQWNLSADGRANCIGLKWVSYVHSQQGWQKWAETKLTEIAEGTISNSRHSKDKGQNANIEELLIGMYNPYGAKMVNFYNLVLGRSKTESYWSNGPFQSYGFKSTGKSVQCKEVLELSMLCSLKNGLTGIQKVASTIQ